jgi:putative oxidoreductase
VIAIFYIITPMGMNDRGESENRRLTVMISTRTAPYAALLLRLTLGGLFLTHLALKLFVFTPAGTAAFFGKVGLPPVLAYVVMSAELLGGIALVLGAWTSLAAILLTPILLGAIFSVHGAAGFFFNNANGGWEFPAFWIVALIVQALLGDGIYALRPLCPDSSVAKLTGAYSS